MSGAARPQGSPPQPAREAGRPRLPGDGVAQRRAGGVHHRAPAGAGPGLLDRPQHVARRKHGRIARGRPSSWHLERAAAGRRGRVRDVTPDRVRRAAASVPGVPTPRARCASSLTACVGNGSSGPRSACSPWLSPSGSPCRSASASRPRVGRAGPHRQRRRSSRARRGRASAQGRGPGRPDRLRQALHLPVGPVALHRGARSP